MKRSLHLFAAPAAALLMLSGCLEFEEQTLQFHHDTKAGTLRIFQDYHGIFGLDHQDDLSETEQEQLRSVLESKRTFFFTNWIFEINRTDLQETLNRLRDPNRRGEEAKSADVLAREERLVKALLENTEIKNGPFYRDAKGRLCGAQFVTLKNVPETLEALNAFVPDFLREQAQEQNKPADEKAALLAAAEHRKVFVSLQGNAFSLTWPITRSDFDKTFGSEAEAGPGVTAFRKCGGKAEFASNEATITIGSVDDSITTVTLPMSEKPYSGNAVQAVKNRTTIAESFDPAAAAKKFLTPEAK